MQHWTVPKVVVSVDPLFLAVSPPADPAQAGEGSVMEEEEVRVEEEGMPEKGRRVPEEH